MFVIVGGLAPQNSPFLVQNYTQCFGTKSLDVCIWILCGVGGIFIYKWLLHYIKKETEKFLFDKYYTKKDGGYDSITLIDVVNFF